MSERSLTTTTPEDDSTAGQRVPGDDDYSVRTDLLSEEHPPSRLVELAIRTEEQGLDFVSISDHFHPWITAQGHSPLHVDRPRRHLPGDSHRGFGMRSSASKEPADPAILSGR